MIDEDIMVMKFQTKEYLKAVNEADEISKKELNLNQIVNKEWEKYVNMMI